MAESLLLPVVRGVVGKAADVLVQTVARMWGVDDDRRKLERHLLSVQSLLADDEVKSETNPAVKAWMRELRAVAYQADDVLDDFQYEALRREAQSGDSKAAKVRRYFTLQSPLLFRLTASSNLNKVLKRINELVTEMHTFGLVERAEAPQPLYRQTHAALVDSSDILGRDNNKEVVVKLLLDQQDQRNVQILPIIGMGGLGKTTLAKMVYNDNNVQKHFELKMWHCVSDNFNAIDVVRSIIELATKARCDLPDTIELLRGKLLEVLGRKRFLLVLDDVWNEEQQKWEDDLKPLLCPSNPGLGSMIVVTSRSLKVASIMGTIPPHELSYLSEDDSWELFSKKAFSKEVQKQPELIKIGKCIVKKCKGLPLALKTMGGLMSSKYQTNEWEAIAQSNRGGNNEVLSILKLSYMHLSYEMKQCFAFCSIFPKDYEMDKDKLIQLWMANNFFYAEETIGLWQKGEFVFNELVWRSFIQDVRVEIFGDYTYTTSPYKKIVCKMHDLMHDLAKDITDECVFAEELVQQKASVNNIQIQLSWYGSKHQITGLMKNPSSLRTLLTQSESTHFSKSDYKVLKKLKLSSLRALCWEYQSVIHRELMNTTHLRYLDFSGSRIIGLSNSICMLYNLQSLILNDCKSLQSLPEGMQTMRKLTHIYLIGCDWLKQMPPKLSLLHNLCTLTKFIVDSGDDYGIEELKDLRQLGNRLELFNLRKVKNGSKVNLHEKNNLTELFLHWGRDKKYNPLHDGVISNNDEVLELLVPHAELKTLGLHGYAGISISHWMRDPQMFQCLRELYISMCPRCKDLPLVWLSSSLEKLYLRRMDRLSALCKNIDMVATGYNTSLAIFPKLKTMVLDTLPELERWAENSAGEPNNLVVFPHLEELRITNCNKIATLPESPILTSLYCCSESIQGLVPMSFPLGYSPSLVRLHIGMLVDMVMPVKKHRNQSQRPLLDSLRSLRVDNENGFISMFNSSKLQLGLGDCLAFVEKLEISSCYNIVRWPVEELRWLGCLRSLGIRWCTKLEGKGSSSEEILPLPHLEKLNISYCESLLEIPNLPNSLEELVISSCERLVALPSNLGDLAQLRHLSLWGCDELKVLPDGMDGLTSLERLRISFCPGIDKFPQGLHQQLPALTFLDILGCPNLQRRCREGGEYFNSLTLIPDKYIAVAREPQIKSFLTLCVGDPKGLFGVRCGKAIVRCGKVVMSYML